MTQTGWIVGNIRFYNHLFGSGTNRTAARTRSIDLQKLGPEFFKLELTKPLFNNNKILTVHNLYNCHTLLNVSKDLKFDTPISIFDL